MLSHFICSSLVAYLNLFLYLRNSSTHWGSDGSIWTVASQSKVSLWTEAFKLDMSMCLFKNWKKDKCNRKLKSSNISSKVLWNANMLLPDFPHTKKSWRNYKTEVYLYETSLNISFLVIFLPKLFYAIFYKKKLFSYTFSKDLSKYQTNMYMLSPF